MRHKLLLLTMFLLGMFLLPGNSLAGKSKAQIESNVKTAIQSVRVPFIKNEGQVDKRVKFYAKTLGGTLFITKYGELVYNLPNIKGKKVKGGIALRETLKGAKVKQILGLEKAETKVNYFIGKDSKNWKTNLETFTTVSFGEVYEKINLRLRAYGNNVEKIFEVKPGGDSKNIALKIEGAKSIKIDKKTGELVAYTELGEVRFTKPIAYQEIGGKRKDVKVSYKLLSKNTYGFNVGDYDKTKPLIIDPFLASTYIGGSNEDRSYSVAVDISGNIYLTGYTFSTDFPTTPGVIQNNNAGNSDAFISVFNSDLRVLVSSTYFGGTGDDYGDEIIIGPAGNVYVTGYTNSTDFPTTSNAFQTSNAGGEDIFISIFSSDLSNLVASTYLGGSGIGNERSDDLAVGSTGNVYVTGYTNSTDFPITSNAFQTSNAGGSDAFISVLSPDLSNLIASTYLGGSLNERCDGIHIGETGNIYVAGGTFSTDFPITSNAFQTSNAGGSDAFISVLSPDLSNLIASTYLGGGAGTPNNDWINDITIDPMRNVYVVGAAYSTDFPTTPGVIQNNNAGGSDAFISVLSPDLSNLIASTYLGGNDSEFGNAISIDTSGTVIVTGSTGSSNFPITPGSFQTTYNGVGDGFLIRLSNRLTTILYSTYLGGNNRDAGIDIGLDNLGNLYVTGYTASTNFPTTPNAYQTTYGGGTYDGFVSWFYFPTLIQPEGFKSKKLSDGSLIIVDNGLFDSVAELSSLPDNCQVPPNVNAISLWLRFVAKVDTGKNGVWIELELMQPIPSNAKIGKCTPEGFKLIENVEINGNRIRFFVEDGGEYDYDGRVDGYVRDPFAVVVDNTATEQELEEPQGGQEEEQPGTQPSTTPSAGSNGGGGGCSTGGMSILLSLLVFAVPFLRRLRG